MSRVHKVVNMLACLQSTGSRSLSVPTTTTTACAEKSSRLFSSLSSSASSRSQDRSLKINLPKSDQNKIITSNGISRIPAHTQICHSSNSTTPKSSGNSVKKFPSFPSRSVVTSQRFVEALPRNMGETKLLSKEERRDFNAIFPDLIQDVVGSPELRDMPETNRWLSKVLEYNVPRGKQNRGLATALAYRYLTNELTPENVHLSYVLGWCVEMMQAFFLVADDIMDGSETRRGRPCWYRVDNMGPAAFNDAILLEASIYQLLKKYFGDKEYYGGLVDIMRDVSFKTTYGQSLDTRTGLEKRYETYTFDRYAAIVKYKTSYYSFHLPVSLAMTMAGINDPELMNQARAITLEMGHFFQVQDDYLDCFGDEEVTGKIGTDIQDGKCSWLMVVALQRANAEQRDLLLENYGKNDPEKIHRVKHLYAEMGISELYLAFEEQNYQMMNTHILQMSPGLPKKLFNDMLEKIYRRSS